MQHKEENRKKLEQFEMTDLYFDRIAVDMNRGWFIFYKKHPFVTKEELLASNLEVFEAKDLVFYDFFYISFSYNINAVSGTLRKSHPKSKFCVREVLDDKWVFDEEKPRLKTHTPEIVILQIMLTGENRALIEYVLKTDFEEMAGDNNA